MIIEIAEFEQWLNTHTNHLQYNTISLNTQKPQRSISNTHTIIQTFHCPLNQGSETKCTYTCIHFYKIPSPSEFWREAAPLKRNACLARLRSPKLRLLGTLEGLSSILSALGERLSGCWPWGELFPFVPELLGLENTRSFRLTFWLQMINVLW